MKSSILFFFAFFACTACSNSAEPDDSIVIITSPDMKDKVDTSPDLVDSQDMGKDQTPDIIEPEVREDIAIELAKLANVESVEELPRNGEQRRFYIDFRLPLDHSVASSPAFIQRAILQFRDYEAPTVLMTSGYNLPGLNDLGQLPVDATNILKANQLTLGHRFFGGAIPDAQNQIWSRLDIKQSADDTHEILQSMRSVLRENWVGTGWSKGGMTILFQEYFYPEDLDFALPMMAPISFGLKDERYPPFLAAIGTQACRDKLKQSMFGALDRKLELADVYNPQTDIERARYAGQIAGAIIAFPWSYWQYYGVKYCDRIPPGNAAANTLVAFFVNYQLPKVERPTNFPRPITEAESMYTPYIYQGMHQLGFQAANPTGLLDEIVALGHLTESQKLAFESYDYSGGDYPWTTDPIFDPQPMQDVDAWLKTDARDIVAIYGEHDPWTAGKITLNPDNNTGIYIAPGGSHSTFLTDLEEADYNAVRDVLLSYDTRDRVRSSVPMTIPKVSETQRETLRKFLRRGP